MELESNEAPNDMEHPYTALGNSMRKKLDTLPPLSSLRCIYTVPDRLKKGNEKFYTPQIVSIGPLHHGKVHLKAMEEHKKRYLSAFIGRTKVSLEDYIKKIKDQEARLRSFYADPIELSSDEFVTIILVDAAFLIEFILRACFLEFREENDYIYDKPMMVNDVIPDLEMLENQLPFFILEDLFDPDKVLDPPDNHSILYFSYFSFKHIIDGEGTEEDFERLCLSGIEIKHFVDLIRICYLPLELKSGGQLPQRRTVNIPAITELHQAGVKFKEGTSQSLFDVQFSNGVLEIPKILLTDAEEVTMRNVLALEQCHHMDMDYLTNYVCLLGGFVKTPKDVELLIKYGVVDNYLGEYSKICTLFNNLGTEIFITNNYYATLLEDLNNYCRTRRHKWMANLAQNYFGTPWSVLSVTAAVILLILTLIQTACSIKSIA